jgi:hypothetical protein
MPNSDTQAIGIDERSGSVVARHRSAVRARALALYLPQFHPIPENDEWWGPGFTEWTNVARARPLFRGHHQPNLPGELGFYDLRLPEVRIAQAELARASGIEGFVYWHYWFAGRRLLERPFDEVLHRGTPDLPFCIAWANQSWTGVWYGATDHVLIEQTYPGRRDYERHFEALLPALRDERYILVDACPLIVVFRPTEIPDPRQFTSTWRALAREAHLPGLHIVGFDHHGGWDPRVDGYDGAILIRFGEMFTLRGRNVVRTVRRRAQRVTGLARIAAAPSRPIHVYPYRELSPRLVPARLAPFESYPCVIPNWDNTPRSGGRGSVMLGSTPELFADQVQRAVELLEPVPPERRLLFIKSWNEWAEGNYLEPDRRWGRRYLEALGAVIRDDRAMDARQAAGMNATSSASVGPAALIP